MDFVNKPTGVADPGFSMDPLVTEEESKADMERAKQEVKEIEASANESTTTGNRYINPLTDEIEETEPVGDGTEGMGFLEFVEQEQNEQEDLPPLF